MGKGIEILVGEKVVLHSKKRPKMRITGDLTKYQERRGTYYKLTNVRAVIPSEIYLEPGDMVSSIGGFPVEITYRSRGRK